MTNRCIAFGCSFTNYFLWPTWADFVGSNFNAYYNFANPGSSNSMILKRLLEVDARLKFAKGDTILIGITAFGRFNWLVESEPNKFKWLARGGPDNWGTVSSDRNQAKLQEQIDFVKKNFWQQRFGIFDTWQLVTTSQRLCELTGSNCKIIMSLDNRHFLEHFPLQLTEQEIVMSEEIYNAVINQESLQEFSDCQLKESDDIHPSPSTHYGYLQKYFPEFITPRAQNFYQDSLALNLRENLVCQELSGKLKNKYAINKADEITYTKLYGGYL